MNYYEIIRACLDLIAQEPGMEAAAHLTNWPSIRVDEAELREAEAFARYWPPAADEPSRRNQIVFGPPEMYPDGLVLESAGCHEAFHYVEIQLGLYDNRHCSEMRAYDFGARYLEPHIETNLAALNYFHRWERRRDQHQEQCEALS